MHETVDSVEANVDSAFAEIGVLQTDVDTLAADAARFEEHVSVLATRVMDMDQELADWHRFQVEIWMG